MRYDLIPAGSKVLCALSGGADSMYLLCRLIEGGYEVCAAHYNHRLRPTAGRDEQFVRSWCADHHIPLTVGSGDVSGHAAKAGTGVEEAARELRYEFLHRAAAETGCTLIATGHHAGDNAETVLMNLIRGCGLNGLTGIPERRGNIIRPMLSVTQDEIIRYLSEHQIPHVEDETNTDQTYTRNRIRHQLIPLLEELNPQAVRHITDAARRLGEDERELTRQTEPLLEQVAETEEGTSVPIAALLSAPRPIALRALRALAPEARSVHLESMLDLCNGSTPSAQLDYPGGTVRRVYDALLFTQEPEATPLPSPLCEGTQVWGRWRITCTPVICPQKAYVDRTRFYLRPDSYRIRSRQEGDAIKLGSRPTKTLKKLMIEEQIPRHLRDSVPVLADSADHPAAVGGFGPDKEALAETGTQCLQIIIRKGE